MSRRLFLFSLLVSAGVGLTQFQGCSVSPPGGVCPDKTLGIFSLSIGVVGPAVVRGCQVLSRTEFREKRGCGGAIIPRFSPRHGEATRIHGLPYVRRWRT